MGPGLKQPPPPTPCKTLSIRRQRTSAPSESFYHDPDDGELTVAVQGPEEGGVGVVRPPAQAAVKVARAVRRRGGGSCGGGEQRGRGSEGEEERERKSVRNSDALVITLLFRLACRITFATIVSPVVVMGTVVVSTSAGRVGLTVSARVVVSAGANDKQLRLLRQVWQHLFVLQSTYVEVFLHLGGGKEVYM